LATGRRRSGRDNIFRAALLESNHADSCVSLPVQIPDSCDQSICHRHRHSAHAFQPLANGAALGGCHAPRFRCVRPRWMCTDASGGVYSIGAPPLFYRRFFWKAIFSGPQFSLSRFAQLPTCELRLYQTLPSLQNVVKLPTASPHRRADLNRTATPSPAHPNCFSLMPGAAWRPAGPRIAAQDHESLSKTTFQIALIQDSETRACPATPTSVRRQKAALAPPLVAIPLIALLRR